MLVMGAIVGVRTIDEIRVVGGTEVVIYGQATWMVAGMTAESSTLRS